MLASSCLGGLGPARLGGGGGLALCAALHIDIRRLVFFIRGGREIDGALASRLGRIEDVLNIAPFLAGGSMGETAPRDAINPDLSCPP